MEGTRPGDIDDDEARGGSVSAGGDAEVTRTGSVADEAAEVEAAAALWPNSRATWIFQCQSYFEYGIALICVTSVAVSM